MRPVFSAPEKLAGQQARRKNIISLTPLIDVVFILLVFFMLASSFMDWQTINLDTAPSARTAVSKTEPMVIAVRGDEALLNNNALSLEAVVVEALERQPADQPVSLQPLENTSTQQLVRVLDALNTAGIAPLKLMDDPNWPPEQMGNGLDMAGQGDKADALP